MSVYISIALVSMVLICMGGAIILLLGDRLAMRNKLEYIQNNREHILKSLNHLSSRQHEFHNHIAVLGSLPSVCSDYDELTTRIAKYTKTLAATRNDGMSGNTLLTQLENKYLAAFLCEKARQAAERQINFALDVKNTQYHIADDDLVELLGTLIDNAFEALEDAPDKHMSLYMGFNRIEVRNSLGSSGSMDTRKVFDMGYSTKKASSNAVPRGLGLHNARQILRKSGLNSSLEAEVLNDTSEVVFRAFVV